MTLGKKHPGLSAGLPPKFGRCVAGFSAKVEEVVKHGKATLR